MSLAPDVGALHSLAEHDTDAVVLGAFSIGNFLHRHADSDLSEIARLFRIKPGGIFHSRSGLKERDAGMDLPDHT